MSEFDPVALGAKPADDGPEAWGAKPVDEPAKKPTYKGAILPFSRDEQGRVSFDPDAGIIGAIKSGLTLAGDVVSGKAKLPSGYGIPGSVPYGDPESSGQRVADMAMLATPVSPISRLSPWGGGVGVNRGGVVGGPYVGGRTLPTQPTTGPLGVTLSEGQATGDLAAIQREQAALRTGDPRAKAFATQQAGEVATARDRISQGFDQFGQTIAETPQQAAQIAQQTIQKEAAARKAGVDVAYGEARALPGEVHAGAFEGIGSRIKHELSLGDNPHIIDDDLTKWASKAIQDVDARVAQLKIQNRADPGNYKKGIISGFEQPDLDGITLKGIDQMRRRLSLFRSNAWESGNTVDGRAASAVVDAFDAQIDKAINGGLFRGDPRAVQAWNTARAAHADYKATFGKHSGDPVSRVVERILGTKNNPAAIPNDVADHLFGATGINPNSQNVAVANRVKTILGPDSPEWVGVQQGLFSRLIEKPPGVTNFGPGKIANRVNEFLSGGGKEMAEAVYSPMQRSLIKQYADLHRSLEVPQAGANWSNNLPMLQQIFSKISSGLASVIGGAIGSMMPGQHSAAVGKIAGAKVSGMFQSAHEARQIVKQMPLVHESALKFQRAIMAYNKAPPSPGSNAMMQAATASLVRNLRLVGIDLQAPAVSRAEDQPEVPRPIQ